MYVNHTLRTVTESGFIETTVDVYARTIWCHYCRCIRHNKEKESSA